MMQAAPLDLQHLRSYTAGDPALEQELFSLFLGSAAEHLQQMRGTCDARNWRLAAHALKGSARGIGAVRVAVLAEAAERLDEAPEPRRAAAVRELARALDAVRDFLDL